MGLEHQVCYNGGAQGSKCTQRRFPHRHYVPQPPTAGGKPKKKKKELLLIQVITCYLPHLFLYSLSVDSLTDGLLDDLLHLLKKNSTLQNFDNGFA